MSADTTPTSVTDGKWSPLVTICVPTSTSASPDPKLSATRACALAPLTASLSHRATLTPGKRRPTSSSTPWTPNP